MFANWKREDYHPSKFIRITQIVLLVLIIIGLALLATQKFWVPKLVDKILKTEGYSDPNPAPKVSTVAPEIVSVKAAEVAFPVPPTYPQGNWKLVSTTFENSQPSATLSGSFISGTSKVSPLLINGEFYEATNTDPKAKTWQEMDANFPGDQPEAFYDGDQSFLAYYDEPLRAAGYKNNLDFDQNFDLDSSGKPAYILSPLGADGPHGTIRGYLKYDSGKVRVVLVASNDINNEVFVSDVFDAKTVLTH